MPKISQIDEVPCQAEFHFLQKTKFATTALSISKIVLVTLIIHIVRHI